MNMSIKMLSKDQTQKEESIDELMAKLAKKGKKIKVVNSDEESDGENLARDVAVADGDNQPQEAPSTTKKKVAKIKGERDRSVEDDKILKQQQELINETN